MRLEDPGGVDEALTWRANSSADVDLDGPLEIGSRKGSVSDGVRGRSPTPSGRRAHVEGGLGKNFRIGRKSPSNATATSTPLTAQGPP